MDNHSEPSMHAESKDNSRVAMSEHLADDLLSTTAVGWRSFYDKLSRRLEDVGVADSSFFLNYGYLAIDSDNEIRFRCSREHLQRQLGPTGAQGYRIR